MTMTRLQKSLIFFAIAMALFTLGRALLYFLYPSVFSSLSTGQVFGAFFYGLRFDGSVVARILAIPFLLMAFPLKRLDRRAWFDTFAWVTYALVIGMFLLLLGDVTYFYQVKRHISYELALIGNDWTYLVTFALEAYWWALILFGLFAAALAWLWLRILRIPFKPMRWAPLQYVVLFLALAIVGRGGPTGKMIELIDAFDGGSSAFGNLALNGVFTTIVFSLNMNPVKHNFYPEKEAVAILGEQRPITDAAYPMAQRYDGKPTGYNIVFVLMESWNFDFVDSFSGKHIGDTPNFDALAKDGLKFTHFYAAGQRSIEGIQATLTGIPMLEGLPRIDAGLGISNFTRLGDVAARHGYHSIFVQTSDRDSFKVDEVAKADGFQQYYGKQDIPLLLKYPHPEMATFGWDYDMLQFLKKKIDTIKKPFIAYCFTGSTHTPYLPVPGHVIRRPYSYDDLNGYINAMSYSDWSIGQFIAAARKEPWFHNTIFMFTADHATHWQQGNNLLQRFHTPFLIYAPGIIKPGTDTVVASQLDVMPTIMDLLGFNDEFSSIGESVFRKHHGGMAMVTEGGEAIGIITDRAYLKHNLHNRLEAHGIDGAVPPSYLDRLQRWLLARDQLSFNLLRSNHWARR